MSDCVNIIWKNGFGNQLFQYTHGRILSKQLKCSLTYSGTMDSWKGTSLLDTGYVYAPYVPLQLTPTMYNPFNFTPIKGIMTRYAKKVVNNRFYGLITIDGVRTFDIRELR